MCVCVHWRECAHCFSNSGESKTNYREKTQAALKINWAQMEAGNKKSGGEDTRKDKPKRRTVRG